MKNIVKIILISLLFQGCEEEVTVVSPTVLSDNVSEIEIYTAKFTGEITFDGGSSVTEYGAVWGTSTNVSLADNKKVLQNAVNVTVYDLVLTDLAPSTTYYVKAYATNSIGTSYGEEISFTTLGLPPPYISAIYQIKCESMAMLSFVDYRSAVVSKGVCWNTSPLPTIANNKTNDGNGTDQYYSNLLNLTPNTIYYIRPYITTTGGVVYGEEKTVKTTPIEIGNFYQGGIISYVLLPGDPGYSSTELHGIILSPVDLPTSCCQGVEWGCLGTFITGAQGTALGTGAQNTQAIITQCSANKLIAAWQCSELDLNNYSDWYLPSKDEAYKLYLNREAINTGSLEYAVSPLSTIKTLWTSSQLDKDFAWMQYASGSVHTVSKNSLGYVRAIRSF